jgi:hypothetical protein
VQRRAAHLHRTAPERADALGHLVGVALDERDVASGDAEGACHELRKDGFVALTRGAGADARGDASVGGDVEGGPLVRPLLLFDPGSLDETTDPDPDRPLVARPPAPLLFLAPVRVVDQLQRLVQGQLILPVVEAPAGR